MELNQICIANLYIHTKAFINNIQEKTEKMPKSTPASRLWELLISPKDKSDMITEISRTRSTCIHDIRETKMSLNVKAAE